MRSTSGACSRDVERTSCEGLFLVLKIHHRRSSAIPFRLLAIFKPKAMLNPIVIVSNTDFFLGLSTRSLNNHNET